MDKDIGKTIWQQIGIMTKMAIGARQAALLEKGIQFRITIHQNQHHKIQITLDPSDTYSIKLYKIAGRIKCYEPTLQKECSGIYCDQLDEILYAYSIA